MHDKSVTGIHRWGSTKDGLLDDSGKMR